MEDIQREEAEQSEIAHAIAAVEALERSEKSSRRRRSKKKGGGTKLAAAAARKRAEREVKIRSSERTMVVNMVAIGRKQRNRR